MGKQAFPDMASGGEAVLPFWKMFANIHKTDKGIYPLSQQITLLGIYVAGICVKMLLTQVAYHNIVCENQR